MKMRKTRFKDSSIREVDFTGTDLHGSVFDNCDLAGAKFENTVLEKTDFQTAYNYSIDPELNQVRKAKFALPAVIGLLAKYDIEIVSG